MPKSKKILLSKIIEETEHENKKAKEQSIKRAYRDLLSLLENIHSANRVPEGSGTIHIFSSIARSADEIHHILQTINKYSSHTPRLHISANSDDGGHLHHDVTIYRARSNFAATVVQFNMPENQSLSDEELDNEYDALLCELRKRTK